MSFIGRSKNIKIIFNRDVQDDLLNLTKNDTRMHLSFYVVRTSFQSVFLSEILNFYKRIIQKRLNSRNRPAKCLLYMNVYTFLTFCEGKKKARLNCFETFSFFGKNFNGIRR